MKLEGLHVVVTGGASGLGNASARALAAAGAHVSIFDINKDAGSEKAAEIGASFHQVDITSEDSVVAGFDAARAKYGQERALVHCAMTAKGGKTVGFDKASGGYRRLSTEDYAFAAEGILEVANTAMERALRVISVERGHDPAEFTLVAFGGAGGLHAAQLADRLGTRRAMVPPRPGLLSAYGMLTADITREVSRTVLISTASANAHGNMKRVFAELGQAAVTEMAEEGVPEDRLTLRQWVDARYERQSFELRVPAEDWDKRFHALHEKRYGYQRPATPVEAVTLRSIASAPGPQLDLERIPHIDAAPSIERARTYTEGEWTEVDRLWRRDLSAGQTLDGPTLVLEYSSTTWVPRSWRLTVDKWGNLHLSAT